MEIRGRSQRDVIREAVEVARRITTRKYDGGYYPIIEWRRAQDAIARLDPDTATIEDFDALGRRDLIEQACALCGGPVLNWVEIVGEYCEHCSCDEPMRVCTGCIGKALDQSVLEKEDFEAVWPSPPGQLDGH